MNLDLLSKTTLIQSVVYIAFQTYRCSFFSLLIWIITQQGKKKKPASLRVVGKQVMTYEILQMYNFILKCSAVGIILIC